MILQTERLSVAAAPVGSVRVGKAQSGFRLLVRVHVLHAELLALQGLPGPAASYLHRALESSEVIFGKRHAPPNAAALSGGRAGRQVCLGPAAQTAGCFGACPQLSGIGFAFDLLGIGDDASRQLLSEKLGSMATAVRASGTAKTIPESKNNHIIK